MAKMSKSETMQFAIKCANENQVINGYTVEQINALGDYNAKTVAARSFAEDAKKTFVINDTSRYPEEFVPTFISKTLKIWNSKVSEAEGRQHRFDLLSRSTTLTTAKIEINRIIQDAGIRGMRHDEDHGYADVRRGNEEVNLYLRWNSDDGRSVNPSNPNHMIRKYTLKTEVAWSSTSRSLNQAAVAIKIYQELVELGQELEARFERETVIAEYGKEVAQPVIVDPLTPEERDNIAAGNWTV